VLLATEGRAIPAAAVERAAELARESGGRVHVFSVARVWGTSFGFPNPGLQPTRHEWKEQHTVVEDAVTTLWPEIQQATLDIVARAYGRVVSSKQVMDTIAHW